jgi:molecular chaperone HtpG
MTHDSAELRTTHVDLSGLFTVLGDHLYSTPAVALRELVQNAHDSCVRREIEAPPAPEGRIVVRTRGTMLAIEDNGADGREVVVDLATGKTGAGATRTLRAATGRDDLIGLFGLGFLSTFVIGDRVTVHTTSYQEPDAGHCYKSRGGERYSIESEPARAVGTVVAIDPREQHASLADPAVLRRILVRYCALLRVGVWLEGDDAPVLAE